MRKLLYIVCYIFLTLNIASAQILKGTISNAADQPIQYSTVYIQDLKQGTVANTLGNYEIRLPAGTYNVFYQSLGYALDIKKVIITSQSTVNLNVTLQSQYYELPEVRISSSGEDPAVIIMRKTISLAPYYLNQVKSYSADVYLKGNLYVIKIPRLLQKSLKIHANNTKIKAGDSFMMESVNKIEFNAPDNYVQRVISFNNTFPTEGNEISPMDLIQASFYEPVIADMAISPLSPEAFNHYNFKFEGASLQGDYLVDKINVIPKRKSQQLFSGTIYIIEDLWCLHSVDLTNDNIAGTLRVRQVYAPVQEGIWLPVSHNFIINIDVVGLRADATYGSSVKYSDVKINSAIPKPDILISAALSKPTVNIDTVKSKSTDEINKLLSKDDLSNRDMVKLSRLMDKETTSKKVPADLEIKEKTAQIIEKDATSKDSAYWADIRPIPLSEVDIISILISNNIPNKSKSDSLSTGSRRGNTLSLSFGNSRNDAFTDSLNLAEKKQSPFVKTFRNIAFGYSWSDTSGFSFRNGGLINISNLRFNTVEGFVYGADFRMSKTWNNNNSFSIYPELRWAFKRENLMGSINTTFNCDGLKQRQIYLRIGKTSKDISSNGGINPTINTFASLFLKRNYLKLYESSYITLGHKWEIVNGLYLDINGTFENRKVLLNNTDFSFIRTGKVYTNNIPVNNYLNDSYPVNYSLIDHRHADMLATFTYTPSQRYRIRNDRKIPAGSDYPTFSISWKHGINEFRQDSLADSGIKHYDFIKIEAYNNKEIGAFSQYGWILRTGTFINNKGIAFQDFTYFNTQPFPLLLNNYQDAFMLPKFYSLSTPRFFIEGHFKYTSPYLLLKLLPGISNTLMRENLSLSYLFINNSGSYTEVGYSISEILLLGEIGIYTGFRNTKYNSTGVKLILRLN